MRAHSSSNSAAVVRWLRLKIAATAPTADIEKCGGVVVWWWWAAHGRADNNGTTATAALLAVLHCGGVAEGCSGGAV